MTKPLRYIFGIVGMAVFSAVWFGGVCLVAWGVKRLLGW